MRRDARTYLWDIQAAADAIERFVAGLDVPAYVASEVVPACQAGSHRPQHVARLRDALALLSSWPGLDLAAQAE
jgi:hypothetical protein